MNATPRRWTLGLALAATLAASLWLAGADEQDAVTTAATAQPLAGSRPGGLPRSDTPRRAGAPAAAAAAAGTAPAPRFTTIQRGAWPTVGDAALRAWMPPPARTAKIAGAHLAPRAPQAASAPPVPAPVAPAFPYQWIGRIESAGVAQIFLASAQRSTSARVGDVLDGQWRVDSIRPTAVQLTWLAHRLPVTIGLRTP